MKSWVASTAGAVTFLVAALAATGTAQAVQYPALAGWSSPAEIAPVGTLCLRTAGSAFIGPAVKAAAAGWNKSDVNMVASTTCAGYPRNRVAVFVAYYDSTKTASGYVTSCAVYDGGSYDWLLVRGKMVWVSKAPVIKLNYTPLAMKQCHATTASRTSTISHEVGHWLGLSHAVGVTVMTSATSRYTTATYYDIRRINGRY